MVQVVVPFPVAWWPSPQEMVQVRRPSETEQREGERKTETEGGRERERERARNGPVSHACQREIVTGLHSSQKPHTLNP
jgi:hypothetical protein